MGKLRSSLEAYKSTIEIILTVGTIQMLSEVKKSLDKGGRTTELTENLMVTHRLEALNIQEKVDIIPQIAVELTSLRHQIADLTQSHHVINSTLQEFMQASENYTSGLVKPFARELSNVDAQETERRYSETLPTPVSSAKSICSACSKRFELETTQIDSPASSRGGSPVS
jgi:hypothetical protein